MLYEIDQEVRATPKDQEPFDGVVHAVMRNTGLYLVWDDMGESYLLGEDELEDLDSVREWEEMESERAMKRCQD